MWDPPNAASLGHEPLAHDVLMKDLSRRKRPLRVKLSEVGKDLGSAPARSRPPELERRLEHAGLGRMRAGVRSVRAIEQTVRPLSFVALDPLVALLPTDAVASAQ